MKKLTFLLTLLMTSIFTLNAHALIEARVSYGAQTVDPEQIGSAPQFSQLTGFGADLIVSPPIIPLAIGLRYEMLSAKESNSFAELETDVTRTSAILSFRPIDTLIFVGIIGTLGLDHGGKTKFDVIGTTIGDFEADNDISSSYSVGVEAGVGLGGILLGGEIGYMGLKLKNDGSSDTELDGAYLKAHVGMGF